MDSKKRIKPRANSYMSEEMSKVEILAQARQCVLSTPIHFQGCIVFPTRVFRFTHTREEPSLCMNLITGTVVCAKLSMDRTVAGAVCVCFFFVADCFCKTSPVFSYHTPRRQSLWTTNKNNINTKSRVIQKKKRATNAQTK